MKNAIITACDAKYGDFLIDHWLVSLKKNTDLKNIDVIVLDYGLTGEQVLKLKKNKVIIFKGVRDGHVNIIRFRDMNSLLSKSRYEQVMSVDGGDIIFQRDISCLFDLKKNSLKAVCEGYYLKSKKKYMNRFFEKNMASKISYVLKSKLEINAGMIVGPKEKFRHLCSEAYSLIKNKKDFGPDQHVINYLLYKNGFERLDSKYNFIITTNNRKFRIEEGVFMFDNGEVIPIVHNAGHFKFFRPISNFGYGKNRNKLKSVFLWITRLAIKMVLFFSKKD